MTILYRTYFLARLNNYLLHISYRSKSRATRFRVELFKELQSIQNMPYMYEQSGVFKYFPEANDYRRMPFKGYSVFYKVEPRQKRIIVFEIIKYQNYKIPL